MLIKLTGKTRFGKNRVQAHGEIWKTKRAFVINPDAWFLESAKTGDQRWVLKKDDQNFNVELISDPCVTCSCRPMGTPECDDCKDLEQCPLN